MASDTKWELVKTERSQNLTDTGLIKVYSYYKSLDTGEISKVCTLIGV